MAGSSLSIRLIFGAENNTSGTFKDITGSLNDLDSAATGLAAPLANVADQVLATEAAVVALAIAFGALAVSTAGSFESSMNLTGRVINATAEETEQLGEVIKSFAVTSSASFDDIEKASFKALSTGSDLTTLFEDLSAAEILSTASGADLEVSIGAIAKAMNNYGREVLTATDAADTFFVAAQVGDTNLQSFGTSFAKVASTAAGAGVDFDTAAAAMAALTITAGSTEEAATQTARAFAALAAPSDALKEVLGGTTLAGDGLQAVLDKIQAATNGDIAAIKELIPNISAANGVMVLAADNSGKFAEATDAMANKTGNAAAAAEAMGKSFDNLNQTMMNALEVSLIDIGTPFLDEAGGIAEGLAEIFKGVSLGFSSDAFSPLLEMIQEKGKELAEALQTIAQNLPEAMGGLDFSGLIDSVGDLGGQLKEAFEGIFGEIDLSTADGLRDALQKVVDGIETLTRVTQGIIQEFQPIFDLVGDLINRSGEAGEEAQVMAGKFLGAAKLINDFGTAVGGLAIVIEDTKADVSAVVDVVIGLFGLMVNGVQVSMNTMTVVISTSLQQWATLFATLLPDAFGGEFFADVAESLQASIDQATGDLIRNGEDAAESLTQLGEGMNGLFDSIDLTGAADQVKEVGEASEQTAEQVGQTVEQFEAMNAAAEGTSAAAQPLNELMESMGLNADGTAKAMSDLATNTGDVSSASDAATESFQANTAAAEENAKAIDESAKAAEDYAESAQKASTFGIASVPPLGGDDSKLGDDASDAEDVFKSLDETMASTGDTLSALFSDLSAFDDPLSNNKSKFIEKQAKIQNELREKALEQQEKLIDAQVKALEASAEAAKRGDNVIKFTTEDVEPSIRELMRVIMRNIQMQGIADQAEFLLNAAGPTPTTP